MVARRSGRSGVGYESAAGKKRLEEFKNRKKDKAARTAGPPKPVKKAKDKITGKGAIRTKDGQLNVTKTQIDKLGMTLTQYVNYFNKHGKRPTAKVTTKSKSGEKPLGRAEVRKAVGKTSSVFQRSKGGRKDEPLGKKEVRKAVEKTMGQRGDKPLTKEQVRKAVGERRLGSGEVRKAVAKTSEKRKNIGKDFVTGKVSFPTGRMDKGNELTKEGARRLRLTGGARTEKELKSIPGKRRDPRDIARSMKDLFKGSKEGRVISRKVGGTAQVSNNKGSHFKGIY